MNLAAAEQFERAVVRALAFRRYPSQRWALIRHVPDATGAARSRVADAVAVSLWPSDGHELHLIEVKSSRGDLTREFRAPEKADGVGRYCHRWWLAVSNATPSTVRVPDGWGVLGVDVATREVTQYRNAPLRVPLVASPGFVAALVRAARDQADRHARGRAG